MSDYADSGSPRNRLPSRLGLPFVDVAGLELEELLGDVAARARDVSATQERLHAHLAMSSEPRLQAALQHLVTAARELVEARSAALGVIGASGFLDEFTNLGMDDASVGRIGELPHGRGVLSPLRRHLSPNGVFGSLRIPGSVNGQSGDEDVRPAVGLAATGGVAIDNARLYQEFEQRHRWLAASIVMTQQLLAGQDEDRLDAVLRTARQTASADFATLAMVVDSGQLQVKAAGGVFAEQVLGLVLDMDSSVAGRVARSREPVLSTEYRDARGVDLPVPVGSVVVVPLLAGDEDMGALSVGRLAGRRPFTDTDVDHLAEFAGHAGVAIRLDDARVDRQQRRISDDRDRIGVDLNRHVIQKLVAVGIGLQSLAAITRPQASRKRINDYVADIDVTIKRIRTTIFDAEPDADADTDTDTGPNVTNDLQLRILAAADGQTSALGCNVVTTFTGQLSRAVPDTLADSAATVVREALATIAAYARATRVELRVDVGGDLITVAILDNGTNIATPARAEAEAVFRCRAETRAGTLTNRTSPDGRTQLVWTAKVPAVH
jgi:signal transduction histidine kinase